MPAPLPPEIILPGPGSRKAYLNPYSGTYTTNRNYAMRMQRGYSRGVPQHEARGKPAGEYRQRQIREQQQYGQTPWERFNIGFKGRYGFSYRYWRQLKRRWVDEINSMASPEAQITPATIAQVKAAWDTGWRDQYRPEFTEWEDWIENRLDENLQDRVNYQDGDKDSAATNFRTRSSVPPIELYWYH